MPDETPDTPQDKVQVKAKKYHTHQGEEHQEGDVYEVTTSEAANLIAQGMAEPVDNG